ncbi:hypothetical protein M2101_000622 [Parabacteroides sp. PM5-20]|nr:hypothetical protein [Parabacteroides sp. PM5-20]
MKYIARKKKKNKANILLPMRISNIDDAVQQY